MNFLSSILGNIFNSYTNQMEWEFYRKNIDYFIPPIIIAVIGGFAYMFDYYNNFVPTTAEINSTSFNCTLENRVEKNFIEKLISRDDYKTIVTKHMDCNAANNLRKVKEMWHDSDLNEYSIVSFKYTSPIDGKTYDKTREIGGEAYPGQMLNIDVWKYNSNRVHIKNAHKQD